MARTVKQTPTITEPLSFRDSSWRFCSKWKKEEILCEGQIVSANKKLVYVTGSFDEFGGMFSLQNDCRNARGGTQWCRDLYFTIEEGKVVEFSGMRHFPLELKARMCALGVEFK